MKYDAKDEKEVIGIFNALDAKLKSSNTHLVLSVIRLFLKLAHDKP